MSSHFNYEIDERNLRAKLKDMSYPYREEAWNQFEMHSENCKHTYKKSSLPSFNLNINRNVILPVVFGGMIILFSMLLFNFVSIKNPKNETAEKTKALSASLPIEPVAEKPAPVKKEEPVAPAVDTTAKAAVITPTQAIAAPTVQTATVTLVSNTVAVTPTVQAPPPSSQNLWTTIESGDVYESPNIKSKVVGNASRNKSFTALEETVYFIKITYDNTGNTGYIRKQYVSKNGMPGTGSTARTSSGTRARKTAESMESISIPAALPTGSTEEKEPELR